MRVYHIRALIALYNIADARFLITVNTRSSQFNCELECKILLVVFFKQIRVS